MIKIVYGEKGSGKTRKLIEKANEIAKDNYGNIVFIEGSNQSMYKLKRDIRFINITEFPVGNREGLIGFICGMIAQNYDTKAFFIDELTYILKKEPADLEAFFTMLNGVSTQHNVAFEISINGNKEDLPGFLDPYIM